MLLEHLERLYSLKASAHLQATLVALRALCEQYEVLEDMPKLNAAGRNKLTSLVENVRRAIEGALGTD